MKTVTIGISPVYQFPDGRKEELPLHRQFIDSPSRRKILVAHRRGLKTTTCVGEVFKYLAKNPKIVGKTLAPIRKQAKEIIWDDPKMLFNLIPKEIIAEVNKTDLKITLKNGSLWYLDGADQPDFQRGGNVKVLHLTEAGDHREEIWSSIYEPVLTLNKGVALFEGNPRGQNWYYKLFENSVDREGWHRTLISARDTNIFTPAELEDIKRSVPDSVFRAEYLCEWVGSSGSVFRNFADLTVLSETPAERGHKYRIGIDLAKIQDFTVLSVVDKHSWDQVRLDRFNQVDWTIIKDRIKEVTLQYSKRENDNAVELLVEGNGVGSPIFDDLWAWASKEKDYNIVVKNFITTAQSKSMLVSNFSMLCDKKEIKLQNNENLKSELGSFTYSKTRDHYIYSAPEGLHDDCVMATLISYWELGHKRLLPNFEELKLKSLEQRFKERLEARRTKNIQERYVI